MLEIIYRIYEVAEEEEAKRNLEKERDFGVYSSISKTVNNELVMDCLVCESREQFKEIIKSQYGEDIAFRYFKKLSAGALYCIIIGEHCFNTNRYFNKITFTCDCCGATVSTYYGKPICFSDYELHNTLFSLEEYSKKRFCSNTCKEQYLKEERSKLSPDSETEYFITREMFETDIAGYIYKITKKSSDEFYVGQTIYNPVFRWGQHLNTERFPLSDICDYKFEVLEIVPKGKNILEREKYYIQKLYKENPQKSLNIMCTAGLIEPEIDGQMTLEDNS